MFISSRDWGARASIGNIQVYEKSSRWICFPLHGWVLEKREKSLQLVIHHPTLSDLVLCSSSYRLYRRIRRAIAAHNNGWEAMNMWVAAVVLARLMGVSTDTMNITAAFWLVSRVL